MAWVLRPGSTQAALATAQTTGTGPGSTRSSGIWLVDLRTGDFKDLAPAAGAEQFPVSWTADGRYLLAASVQAQGVCSYSIIDANEKKVTSLPDALTFCGPSAVASVSVPDGILSPTLMGMAKSSVKRANEARPRAGARRNSNVGRSDLQES